MQRYLDGPPVREFDISRKGREHFDPSPSCSATEARGGASRLLAALQSPSLLVNEEPSAANVEAAGCGDSVRCCIFETGGGMSKHNASRSDSLKGVTVLREGMSAAVPRTNQLNLIKESEVRFRRLVEAVTDYIYTVEIVDGEPARTRHCPKCEAVTGYTPEEYAADPSLWFRMVHPDDRDTVLEMASKMVTGESAVVFEHRILHKNGSVRWVRNTKVSYYDATKGAFVYDGLICDITEHKAMDEALRVSEEKFRTLFNSAGDAILITDAEGGILEANQVACNCLDYEREELLRMNSADISVSESPMTKQWLREVRGETAHIFETVLVTRSMRTIPVEVSARLISYGNSEAILCIVRDVTERKNFEEQLRRQANFDLLTGLPNRTLLYDRLANAIIYKDRHHQSLAVMLLDLDRFKYINDTLGHSVGDLVLKGAAKRLQKGIRKYDTVARLGGDEFVIVLNDITTIRNVARFAEKVLGFFADPFEVNGQEIFITASIGVTVFPADGDSVDSLLKNADVAMYHAKEQGRNNYQFFTSEMNLKGGEQLVRETRLRRALERNEFVLHFQPRIDQSGGDITGVEALIRWQPDGSTPVLPGEFIPLLEETGLIVPVGEWVIRTACAQNRAWQESGLPPFRVAVNISARQFRQKGLPRTIRRILKETGLDPQYLEIELTESVLMADADETAVKLDELKRMGVTISIDDFGTGYSSLSYLKRFPIDLLKIDRSFVDGLVTDPNDTAIVTTIIVMAHALKMRVVAEGVETREQQEFLLQHRCEEVQGYYFSRPLPANDLKAWMTGSGRGGQRSNMSRNSIGPSLAPVFCGVRTE